MPSALPQTSCSPVINATWNFQLSPQMGGFSLYENQGKGLLSAGDFQGDPTNTRRYPPGTLLKCRHTPKRPSLDTGSLIKLIDRVVNNDRIYPMAMPLDSNGGPPGFQQILWDKQSEGCNWLTKKNCTERVTSPSVSEIQQWQVAMFKKSVMASYFNASWCRSFASQNQRGLPAQPADQFFSHCLGHSDFPYSQAEAFRGEHYDDDSSLFYNQKSGDGFGSRKQHQCAASLVYEPCGSDSNGSTNGDSTLIGQGKTLPWNSASFSPSILGQHQCDSGAKRHILPFSHPNYFDFLRSLPQNEFICLSRSVARYRRTSRLDSTSSAIISINLCACCTPHPGPVCGAKFETSFWMHALPNKNKLHGVSDAHLSMMLVELRPELPVVEFLDHRLPAIIRQQVGNRLDRNFVVQIFGISFMRVHLLNRWTIGDLPECTAADMRRLCSHPLYHYMLCDIGNRRQMPIFRNFNLCPIQYSGNRPLPSPSNNTQPSFSNTHFSPQPLDSYGKPPSACFSAETAFSSTAF